VVSLDATGQCWTFVNAEDRAMPNRTHGLERSDSP